MLSLSNYKLGLATSKISTQTMKARNDFNWNTAADKHLLQPSITPAGGKFVYIACSISHLIQPEMDENGLNINTRFRKSKSKTDFKK